MNRRIILLVLLSLPVTWAESTPLFEQAGEEAYFMWTRNDLRMCPSPECGGFYVKALNRIWTICADGSKTSDCHILQLDFSLLEMTEKEQADFQQAFTQGTGIIKGELLQTQQNDILFPALKVYETWLAQADKEPSKGGFFRVHDIGIQCITTPCLTVEEGLINLPGDRLIAGVDLLSSGAGNDQVNAGYLEMKAGFVIATGRNEAVQGPAGVSQILVANEFYLPTAKVEKCGNTVCSAGLTCCNASYGICTPPDMACIQAVRLQGKTAR